MRRLVKGQLGEEEPGPKDPNRPLSPSFTLFFLQTLPVSALGAFVVHTRPQSPMCLGWKHWRHCDAKILALCALMLNRNTESYGGGRVALFLCQTKREHSRLAPQELCPPSFGKVL